MSADKASEKNPDTRIALLDAADVVFGLRGFSGATVKDLAEAAGVNISLINYHFNGKEGLYKACLERFAHGGLAFAEKILKAPASEEDFTIRLRLFCDEVMDQHVNSPEITSLIHRECTGDDPILREVFQNVFVRTFETLMSCMKSAQKTGILRDDRDILLSTMLFWGSMIHMMWTDGIQERTFGHTIKNKKYRDRLLDHAIGNFLDGVRGKRKSEKS